MMSVLGARSTSTKDLNFDAWGSARASGCCYVPDLRPEIELGLQSLPCSAYRSVIAETSSAGLLGRMPLFGAVRALRESRCQVLWSRVQRLAIM